MDFENLGPTALIVGGSTGIGAAIAQRLAEQGINLVLTGRSRETLRDQRGALMARHAVEVDIFADDITSEGAVDRLCDFVADKDLGLVT